MLCLNHFLTSLWLFQTGLYIYFKNSREIDLGWVPHKKEPDWGYFLWKLLQGTSLFVSFESKMTLEEQQCALEMRLKVLIFEELFAFSSLQSRVKIKATFGCRTERDYICTRYKSRKLRIQNARSLEKQLARKLSRRGGRRKSSHLSNAITQSKSIFLWYARVIMISKKLYGNFCYQKPIMSISYLSGKCFSHHEELEN